MTEIHLTRAQYLELEKLDTRAFAPVTGFMTEEDYRSVVSDMRLQDGTPFPLPITLDTDAETAASAKTSGEATLLLDGVEVGTLQADSVYAPDKEIDAPQIYGTGDLAHPGVRFYMEGGSHFIGGPATLTKHVPHAHTAAELAPAEARALFKSRGWNTVAGFQTRNVPHRAHEYLQRVALEHTDGLFVQPLIGRKKEGDYTPEAILAGYRVLVNQFFAADRVVLGILTTSMRYAGPREAVFHAIIRRNYGCTHFIVGRDHAGVGDYYGKYDAHDLTRHFDGELGIEILRLSGPFHCAHCDSIATEKTCRHFLEDRGAVSEISGTDMRAILSGGALPGRHLMRPEVVDAVQGIPLFITGEDT